MEATKDGRSLPVKFFDYVMVIDEDKTNEGQAQQRKDALMSAAIVGTGAVILHLATSGI